MHPTGRCCKRLKRLVKCLGLILKQHTLPEWVVLHFHGTMCVATYALRLALTMTTLSLVMLVKALEALLHYFGANEMYRQFEEIPKITKNLLKFALEHSKRRYSVISEYYRDVYAFPLHPEKKCAEGMPRGGRCPAKEESGSAAAASSRTCQLIGTLGSGFQSGPGTSQLPIPATRSSSKKTRGTAQSIRKWEPSYPTGKSAQRRSPVGGPVVVTTSSDLKDMGEYLGGYSDEAASTSSGQRRTTRSLQVILPWRGHTSSSEEAEYLDSVEHVEERQPKSLVQQQKKRRDDTIGTASSSRSERQVQVPSSQQVLSVREARARLEIPVHRAWEGDEHESIMLQNTTFEWNRSFTHFRISRILRNSRIGQTRSYRAPFSVTIGSVTMPNDHTFVVEQHAAESGALFAQHTMTLIDYQNRFWFSTVYGSDIREVMVEVDAAGRRRMCPFDVCVAGNKVFVVFNFSFRHREMYERHGSEPVIILYVWARDLNPCNMYLREETLLLENQFASVTSMRPEGLVSVCNEDFASLLKVIARTAQRVYP